MLFLSTITCVLWFAHFFLLGAATGAFMNVISAGRSFVYYKVKPGKKNRWIMYSFLGLLVVITIGTWHGAVSLLPLIGSACSVVGDWQKKPKYIRRLNLGTPPPWFVYNVINGSYPGMAVEVLKTISNLIGQYRFDFKRSTRRKLLRVFKPAWI